MFRFPHEVAQQWLHNHQCPNKYCLGQVRILKGQIAELEDAGKSKDAANKRCLQKLEFCTKDLDDALTKIKQLEEDKKD